MCNIDDALFTQPCPFSDGWVLLYHSRNNLNNIISLFVQSFCAVINAHAHVILKQWAYACVHIAQSNVSFQSSINTCTYRDIRSYSMHIYVWMCAIRTVKIANAIIVTVKFDLFFISMQWTSNSTMKNTTYLHEIMNDLVVTLKLVITFACKRVSNYFYHVKIFNLWFSSCFSRFSSRSYGREGAMGSHRHAAQSRQWHS